MKTECLLSAGSGTGGAGDPVNAVSTPLELREGTASLFFCSQQKRKARPSKSPDSSHCHPSRAGTGRAQVPPSVPEHNGKGVSLTIAGRGKNFCHSLLKFHAPEFLSNTKLVFMVNKLFKFVLENIKNTTRKGDERTSPSGEVCVLPPSLGEGTNDKFKQAEGVTVNLLISKLVKTLITSAVNTTPGMHCAAVDVKTQMALLIGSLKGLDPLT